MLKGPAFLPFNPLCLDVDSGPAAAAANLLLPAAAAVPRVLPLARHAAVTRAPSLPPLRRPGPAAVAPARCGAAVPAPAPAPPSVSSALSAVTHLHLHPANIPVRKGFDAKRRKYFDQVLALKLKIVCEH